MKRKVEILDFMCTRKSKYANIQIVVNEFRSEMLISRANIATGIANQEKCSIYIMKFSCLPLPG